MPRTAPTLLRNAGPAAAVRLALAGVLAGVSVGASAEGDPAAGKKVYTLCSSCHAIGPSARAGFGPQLNALFGRRAGTSAVFDAV